MWHARLLLPFVLLIHLPFIFAGIGRNPSSSTDKEKVFDCELVYHKPVPNKEQPDLLLTSSKVHFFAKKIAEGAYGKVYKASAENLYDFNGDLVSREEVAVKVIAREEDEEVDQYCGKSFFNEVDILTKFNEFKKWEDRRHVIQLIQSGTLETSKSGLMNANAYVMELGEMDLRTYIRGNQLDYGQIQSIVIRGVALAMRDFHKLAIHFDLKPGNLVFVGDTLKVIDFGASKFIVSSGDKMAKRNLANVCVCIWEQVTTRVYRSPENNIKCDSDRVHGPNEKVVDESDPGIPLSSKVDIWAIGVIALETILKSQRIYAEIFNEMIQMDERRIRKRRELSVYEILDNLLKLYKFDRATCEREFKKNNTNYSAYILLLLKLRVEDRQLYKLITALLEYDPKDRLSARGILDYLDNKCRLREPNKMKAPILIDEKTKNEILAYLVNKIFDKENEGNSEQEEMMVRELTEVSAQDPPDMKAFKFENDDPSSEYENAGPSSVENAGPSSVENAGPSSPKKLCDTRNTENSPELRSIRKKIREEEWDKKMKEERDRVDLADENQPDIKELSVEESRREKITSEKDLEKENRGITLWEQIQREKMKEEKGPEAEGEQKGKQKIGPNQNKSQGGKGASSSRFKIRPNREIGERI